MGSDPEEGREVCKFKLQTLNISNIAVAKFLF